MRARSPLQGVWCYLYRGIDEDSYYPTLGFGEFEAAQRFCRAVDEVGNFLRPRARMTEFVCLRVGEASLLENRRQRFMKGVEELEALFKAA